MTADTAPAIPRVLQVADLSGIGGVEQKVRFYLRESGKRGRLEHHLLVIGRRIHPALHPDIEAAARSVLYGKYCGRLKLPKWPGWLRERNFIQQVKQANPDAIMVWNRFGDTHLLQMLRAASAAPIIHCECGGAWYKTPEADAQAYLKQLAATVCASHACRRVLELRWGWQGTTASEINGLRPDCQYQQAIPKTFGGSRRIKLGIAARVSPRKGASLVIHALARLRAAGHDVELHLAGDLKGNAGDALRKAVQKLNLTPYVTFHGVVHDMAAFYTMIDIFLCPSLREPFGSVCLEAAAFGCIVVATKVDGLVEAVQDGVTGRCIIPELPLEDYPRYGGPLAGLPEFAYDPDADAIVKLRILDPTTIAEVIADLISHPETCASMSAAGMKRAQQDLHFDHFVNALDQALENAHAASPPGRH
jgi:glycosyltransferase involved in cell wall biosynthesis